MNASKKFNIIITTGGASVGDEDHLIKALSSLGKIYFWRAAIKPGRPLAFGKIKNVILFVYLETQCLFTVIICNVNQTFNTKTLWKCFKITNFKQNLLKL